MSREKTRIRLQRVLEGFSGIKKVYFQPPASISMEYPCIVFNYDNETKLFANGNTYLIRDRYTVTIITKDPFPEALLEAFDEIPYCRFSRQYSSDNLHHFAYDVTLTERI